MSATHACSLCPATKVAAGGDHPCGCEFVNGTFIRTEPVVVRFQRALDGSHYASRCLMCAKAWKVYQRRACNCATTSVRYEREVLVEGGDR